MASYAYIHGSGTGLRSINDIYYEGRLIWLEADMIIRRESGGKRSLDDFCRLFFGGRNRGAEVRTYTRRDVIAALQRTQPYTWDAFIQQRIYDPPSGTLTQGMELAGWRLEFGNGSDMSPFNPFADYLSSVGVGFLPNGAILAVTPDSPAERAGLKPGMHLTGADGGAFNLAALRAAVRATKDSKTLLELWTVEGPITAASKTNRCSSGRREWRSIPSLVRIPDTPDLLEAVTASTASHAF